MPTYNDAKETIRQLVSLVDELRQPYNNSKYHDLYMKATESLNRMENEGRIPLGMEPVEPVKISYGETAYVAYCEHHHWHIGNLPLPKWHQLQTRERDSYEAVARAVLRKRLQSPQG